MKYVSKKTIILAMIGILVLGCSFYIGATRNYSTPATYFTYDENLGKTIVVGPDADEWIPVEEYHDNSWSVDWNTEKKIGEKVYYKGCLDGMEFRATKEYWDAVAMSRQPEVFFGYVHVKP